MKEELFDDSIVGEYVEWKNANPENFSWWNFVNLKSDIQTALGFAKFFYPDVIEVEGCFLLKDKYSPDIFKGWKKHLNNNKTQIEKMMNLYEVGDFFHINKDEEENEEVQIIALGDVLKHLWTLSFKDRFPDRKINVDVFQEDDDVLFITVYELINKIKIAIDEWNP
ncbi:hypothetical protein [Clostridium sp. YIM B02569]|uniref:hypothetical protein n=1 Tax=Clostridium sp. YIM B02569 TaxID=2911967 RepID=UPI001EEB86EA|nr:hypothetical protein [Clostridium sp. YIM B02569]